MSRATVVAKRYAKALFEIARQQEAVTDVEQQLKAVVAAIGGDAEVARFLSYPNIEASRKIDILKQALAGKVSEMVLNAVELLVERGRLSEIGAVYEAYTKIAGEALGQADAVVYTAKPLDESDMAKVTEQFGALIGKKVRAEQMLQPSLLGGIQVRIGDRLYDGSLSGKLERLEKSLQS